MNAFLLWRPEFMHSSPHNISNRYKHLTSLVIFRLYLRKNVCSHSRMSWSRVAFSVLQLALVMANAGYHLSCREGAYSHSLKNDLGPSSDQLQSPCFAMLNCSTGVIALCLQDASHLLLHQLHVVQSINLTLCKCLYI